MSHGCTLLSYHVVDRLRVDLRRALGRDGQLGGDWATWCRLGNLVEMGQLGGDRPLGGDRATWWRRATYWRWALIGDGHISETGTYRRRAHIGDTPFSRQANKSN